MLLQRSIDKMNIAAPLEPLCSGNANGKDCILSTDSGGQSIPRLLAGARLQRQASCQRGSSGEENCEEVVLLAALAPL